MFLADSIANSTGGQVSAFTLLGMVVLWVLRRMSRIDEIRENDIKDGQAEIAALEQKLDTLREDNAEQHAVKHKALNRVSYLEGRAKLVGRAARDCTCGAMAPVRVLLDEDL